MKKKPDSPDRRLVSNDLRLLSLQYDLTPEIFPDSLQKFQDAWEREANLHGIKKVRVRHIARADGRQRFVIFFDGKPFDYFDFTALEMGGPGFEPSDPDDPGFLPFDA